jgi:hypothetical protein
MKHPSVYVLSRDPFWRQAVIEGAGSGVSVKPIECPEGYPDCLEAMPDADPEALLLLDATGQSDVVSLARGLSAGGWGHIVVVAADPCSGDARAVLRERVAEDYWPKTYARKAIQRDIRQYMCEVWGIDNE